jgi:predicted DNA-binding antitoxin AbrB/MazE fold protein
MIVSEEDVMTITIDATYEDGVFKPAQPLPLGEHAHVRLTVEPRVAEMAQDSGNSRADDGNELTLGERIAALSRDLPPQAFEGLPTDGASQHDHYIYGTPKRTDLTEPE